MAYFKRLTSAAGLAALAAGYVHGLVSRRFGEPMRQARRGRGAASPIALPWRGWKDVLLRFGVRIQEARVLSLAGAVAFFTLLSLVPALSLLVTLYGGLTDPATIVGQLDDVTILLPQAARELIREQAVRLSARDVTDLSLTVLIGFLVAIWSANAAMKAAFDALNIIYGVRERRGFIRLNLVSLATTLSALVVLILALSLIASLPVVTALFPFGHELEVAIRWLRWPAFFLVGTVAIGCLYWIGPNRKPPRFAWVLPGAIAAALLWLAASIGFSWYVSTLGRYTATYGSLATIVVFMTWLWLSATIVLAGAELNAELEHQSRHGSAPAPSTPLSRTAPGRR
ncbi:YihY/virulence factor BrkB family protein [Bosea sp. CS1GBMeth4]|uniref:YihY/virulence factor BrkB family protein n=1 Tax=Bosea sp. CS1GBMeth4 TaxID=1892849 RepID=UPI0016456B39|nr:YihY/virulence factor BrkB family protein [Bosea sp. CS1GBMeth4]